MKALPRSSWRHSRHHPPDMAAPGGSDPAALPAEPPRQHRELSAAHHPPCRAAQEPRGAAPALAHGGTERLPRRRREDVARLPRKRSGRRQHGVAVLGPRRGPAAAQVPPVRDGKEREGRGREEAAGAGGADGSCVSPAGWRCCCCSRGGVSAGRGRGPRSPRQPRPRSGPSRCPRAAASARLRPPRPPAAPRRAAWSSRSCSP